MQIFDYLKPLFINTDTDELLLKDGAVRYLKNYRSNFNKGKSDNGGNAGVGTANQANSLVNSNFLLPAGINKNCGGYECMETKEFYYCNWNSNGFHGVYVIDRKFNVQMVAVDPKLNFQLAPEYSFGQTGRMCVKVVYKDVAGVRVIKEKHLLMTDGYNWQFWINVLAAIGSNSFATPATYWKTNDRSEYYQYPVRPPMYPPTFAEVPFTDSDKGKPNFFLRKSVQFAYRYILTDGRATPYSPYSNKYALTASPCGVDQSGVPRCLLLTLDPGSPLVERIELIYRKCGGDWYRCDTLNAFDSCDEKENYWERDASKRWASHSYNAAANKIYYTFCEDKECAVISQDEVRVFYNDIAIKNQTLVSAGDAILLGNGLYNYPNLKCDQINAIDINVIPPAAANECKIEMRKIRIGIVVHNIDKNWNQAIYKTDKGSMALSADTYVFGGLTQNDNTFPNNVKIDQHIYTDYKQSFPVGTNIEGFLVYSPNSTYKGRTLQKRYNVSGGVLEAWGGASCLGCGTCSPCIRSVVTQFIRDNKGFYVQVVELEVPKGIYPIRIASHLATEDSDYEKTSTYTICTIPFSSYSGKMAIDPDSENYEKEILIDVCDKDWDFITDNKIFIVADNTVPEDALLDTGHMVMQTYLNDSKGFPVELAKTAIGSLKVLYNNITDHNGFVWAVFDRKVILGSNKHALEVMYRKSDCTDQTWESQKFAKSTLYDLGVNVIDASPVSVKGKVIQCDNKYPLGGVRVMLTRGQGAVTKQDGSFEIIAHDEVGVASRSDKLVMVQANISCFAYDCNCNCVSLETVSFPACTATERIINVTRIWELKVAFASSVGLKGGGRYGIGFQAYDAAGRCTFIQRTGYIDIPSFITNGGIFKPSAITWAITGNMNLPDWVTKISFFRTGNLAHDNYIQWQADSLEYLDENGEVTTAPSKAMSYRLSIESLLRFNELHNFGTTTKYQWKEKDYVRFYSDSTGKMFTEYIDLIATATEDGKYLILPYDVRVKDLVGKCNFWIEIASPKVCEDKELYCEICGMIDVIEGEPVQKSGTLSTWDTFYQTRKITSTNPACSNQTTLIHPFESPSVSDLWGENCPSCGRVSVIDEKAEQKWYPDTIHKSNEFVNEGRVNGLGTFNSANKKSFKGQDRGGIIVMVVASKVILVVGENDWFAIDYDMNYARTDSNGFLVASTTENNIGEPYQKIGDAFGCNYEDVATVIQHDAVVTWVDKKRSGFIVCDYRSAKDMSIEAECKSYFIDKLKYMQYENSKILLADGNYSRNCWEIVCGLDVKNEEINITFRPRRDLFIGYSAYINNERELRVDHQETIIYSLDMKKFTQLAGYCPEGYGTMRFADSGMQMLTFAAGYAYAHNSNEETQFNKFYGVEVEQVIDAIFNIDSTKVKVFQAVNIDSIQGYHADRISTNEPNSMSWLSVNRFKKKENLWYSTILCDAASYPDVNRKYVSMLIDGKFMRGLFLRLRLVKDIKNLTGYNELNSIAITYIASERSKNDNREK